MGNKNKRIGVLGGTFDPVHFGHLHLAIALLERRALSEVLFCPTAISPFKLDRPPAASLKQRIEMLELSLKGLSFCSIWDGELRYEGRGGPSFTIDALKELQQERLDAQLYLLMGEDTLFGFERWKSAEELVRIAPPLIGSRPCDGISLNHLPQQLRQIIADGLTTIPMMEISSSDVRERLTRGQYCGHLIPFRALNYIREQHLYGPNTLCF